MGYKLTSLIALACLFLQACSDSNTELPNVSSDTVYSCTNYVIAKSNRDYREIERIEGEIAYIFDREYSGDTSVERFYRKRIKFSDYTENFRSNLREICSENASMPVTDAATQAINQVYAWAMKDLKTATCEAYNDGRFDFDEVKVEFDNPANTFGRENVVRALLKSDHHNFTAEDLERNLDNYCEKNPDARLWSSIYSSAAPAIRAAIEEEERQKKEEEDRKREETRQAELSLFATDLTKSEITNNCEHYTKLYRLFSRRDSDEAAYAEALSDTVTSMADQLMPYQRRAFDELMLGGEDIKAHMDELCDRSINSGKPLHQVLLEINKIANAKTDDAIYLENLYEQKQQAINCPQNESYCESEFESTAAGAAIFAWRRCEENPLNTELTCFSNPNDTYRHSLSEVIIRTLTRENMELEHRLRGITLQDMESLNECKSKLNFVNEEYIVQSIIQCEQPMLAELRNPYITKIDENNIIISREREKMAAIAQLATRPSEE